ncbi:hypothetical protein [Rhizobium sp. PL01]|uniref:hypothetical protein n=1 Tax=Rhizobium sp. PL01 TaxID=3085631 RepID=UPI0029815E02|nr:hypothetical protein [Rhizobium sp. PL01]MDW5317087.1 hypothetical protein [Rhizobium sp. PL01]
MRENNLDDALDQPRAGLMGEFVPDNDYLLSDWTVVLAQRAHDAGNASAVEVHSGGEANHPTGNAVRSALEAIVRFCHPDKSESLSGVITFLAGEENFTIESVLINKTELAIIIWVGVYK